MEFWYFYTFDCIDGVKMLEVVKNLACKLVFLCWETMEFYFPNTSFRVVCFRSNFFYYVFSSVFLNLKHKKKSWS